MVSVAGDERSEEQRKRGARVSDVWVRVVFVHHRNRQAPPKSPSLKHPTNVPRCSLDSTCRWHMCTECPASPRGSGRTGSGCTNTSVCGGASVCVSVSVCARGGEGLPTYPPTYTHAPTYTLTHPTTHRLSWPPCRRRPPAAAAAAAAAVVAVVVAAVGVGVGVGVVVGTGVVVV